MMLNCNNVLFLFRMSVVLIQYINYVFGTTVDLLIYYLYYCVLPRMACIMRADCSTLLDWLCDVVYGMIRKSWLFYSVYCLVRHDQWELIYFALLDLSFVDFWWKFSYTFGVYLSLCSVSLIPYFLSVLSQFLLEILLTPSVYLHSFVYPLDVPEVVSKFWKVSLQPYLKVILKIFPCDDFPVACHPYWKSATADWLLSRCVLITLNLCLTGLWELVSVGIGCFSVYFVISQSRCLS